MCTSFGVLTHLNRIELFPMLLLFLMCFFFSYSNRVISRLIRLLFRWCVCSIFNIISYNLFDTARSQESLHQANTVPIESDELIWIHCMHRQTGYRMQIRHFNWYFLNRICHLIPMFNDIHIHSHTHIYSNHPPLPNICCISVEKIQTELSFTFKCIRYDMVHSFNTPINNWQTVRENMK